jgi:hypothetical protein
VELQNIRSIRDGGKLHDDQQYLREELRETRASLKRLEDFVDRVVAEEQERRKARGGRP